MREGPVSSAPDPRAQSDSYVVRLGANSAPILSEAKPLPSTVTNTPCALPGADPDPVLLARMPPLVCHLQKLLPRPEVLQRDLSASRSQGNQGREPGQERRVAEEQPGIPDRRTEETGPPAAGVSQTSQGADGGYLRDGTG